MIDKIKDRGRVLFGDVDALPAEVDGYGYGSGE